jgi:hypothetical protein
MLPKPIGFKKTTVAVARKMAVILHRKWHDGTVSFGSTKEASVQRRKPPRVPPERKRRPCRDGSVGEDLR